MTDLIAVLSSGKGTWAELGRLIAQENWENIYLITDEFGMRNFKTEKKLGFVLIDSSKSIRELKEKIILQLKEKLQTEVAVNFVSGTGKEHMALLSALLSLGVGIRFVVAGAEAVEEV